MWGRKYSPYKMSRMGKPKCEFNSRVFCKRSFPYNNGNFFISHVNISNAKMKKNIFPCGEKHFCLTGWCCWRVMESQLVHLSIQQFGQNTRQTTMKSDMDIIGPQRIFLIILTTPHYFKNKWLVSFKFTMKFTSCWSPTEWILMILVTLLIFSPGKVVSFIPDFII